MNKKKKLLFKESSFELKESTFELKIDFETFLYKLSFLIFTFHSI